MKSASLLLLITVIFSISASAQNTEIEEFKFLYDQGEATDGLGEGVALYNNVALLGAPAVGTANFSAGYVVSTVFSDGVWAFDQKLVADDAQLDDRFGFSVAIYEDMAVVGAPEADAQGNGSGAAYVFAFADDAWTQIQKLTPPEGSDGAEFGTSVAIFENLVLVGAPVQSIGGDPVGAAYLYEFEGDAIVDQQEITFGDFSFIAKFGQSVALGVNLAAIGVPNRGQGAQNFGSVFLFEKEGDDWVFLDELQADDAQAQDVFGSSVSVSGEYLVAGAPREDDDGSNTGAVYVFENINDQWTQVQRLKAPVPSDEELFGLSVSVDGSILGIGVDRNDLAAIGAGTAYVFENDGGNWVFAEQLIASDAAIGDDFGRRVAVHADVLVAGAAGENGDMAKESVGAAYFYRVEPTSVSIEKEILPGDWAFDLLPVYPNPLRGTGIIPIDVHRPSTMTIELFDALGRSVSIIHRGGLSAGKHKFSLDGSALSAGMYYVRFTGPDGGASRPIHIIH